MRRLGRTSLLEACGGLLATRQRAVLALIGIVVGVASVSSMISVGKIVKDEAARQFQELGTDVLAIAVRARDKRRGRARLELSVAERIDSLPGLAAAAPFTRGAAHVTIGGASRELAEIVGATGEFAVLNRLPLAEGRFISRLDRGQYFCTLGAGIAEKLRKAAGAVVGESLRIGDTACTVVGALAPATTQQRAFDANRIVAMPIGTAALVIPNKTLRDIVARMSPGTGYREATKQIEDYFRFRAPDMRVRVRSPEQLIEQLHRQMRLYTLLLGTVGAISLLVGGIGVMNVMLVAVAERKGEIGLRRAVGARRADIQAQFLVESTILSLAGGAIGAGLSFAATWGICRFAGWAFAVSAEGAVLGTAVAAGAGVFFGFYPAWQAARLNPVAALRG